MLVKDHFIRRSFRPSLDCGWAWCFDVVGLGAYGCRFNRVLRFVPCWFGFVFFEVMRDVRGFDVVAFVVLQVVDFPPLLFRNPFVNPANDSVDGGIVDEVDDDNRISFPDR